MTMNHTCFAILEKNIYILTRPWYFGRLKTCPIYNVNKWNFRAIILAIYELLRSKLNRRDKTHLQLHRYTTKARFIWPRFRFCHFSARITIWFIRTSMKAFFVFVCFCMNEDIVGSSCRSLKKCEGIFFGRNAIYNNDVMHFLGALVIRCIIKLYNAI